MLRSQGLIAKIEGHVRERAMQEPECGMGEQTRTRVIGTAAFTACFVVRTIFSIIGVAIREELGLSEFQFGRPGRDTDPDRVGHAAVPRGVGRPGKRRHRRLHQRRRCPWNIAEHDRKSDRGAPGVPDRLRHLPRDHPTLRHAQGCASARHRTRREPRAAARPARKIIRQSATAPDKIRRPA